MQRKVTLTFDNGPYAGATDQILDILGKRNIRATFFLVGQRLAEEETRALARRTVAEGHWIGHHSMRHLVPLGWSEDPDHPRKEIAEADEAVKEYAHPNKFFRPPGKARLGPHILSKAALDYCMANGHTIVTWNDIPGDGQEPFNGWVERALASVRKNEWTVPVLHDHHLVKAMDNLSTFLDRAIDEGGTFVQEFPDEVIPLWRGQIRQPVEQFVTLS